MVIVETPCGFFKIWLNPKERSSPSEVFLGKDVLQISSKVTGEHPCRSAVKCYFCKKFNKTIKIANYEQLFAECFLQK